MLRETTYPPSPPPCDHTCTTAPPSTPTAITGADTEVPMFAAGGLLLVGIAAVGIARWFSGRRRA